ncbi:MAG: UbiH/UbiF family hydroxylase [Marinovum sp.]|nr:UbiH/UbiF family hydroxylase [Marinovum sp.]
MTEQNHFDIIIAGGGIAGLAAATAFGQAGFHTLIVDPSAPIIDRDSDGADLRSTAFLQPARDFLDRIGLWERLGPYATPLATMQIMDASGEKPVSRAFESADISEDPFGWNLPNWLLRREFSAALASQSQVSYRPGIAATGLRTRTGEAFVSLSDGTRARAKLAVACDGRNSTLRQAARIDVQTTRFGQKALAFAVTHPIPHENVSTEVHRSGGPFTLVPLPDHDGRPSSAVVWMEDGPTAQDLYALAIQEFETAMTERSTGLLGPLKLASQRTIWPIIAQSANALHSERLAIAAEAAHVVPPIGAQGLNMSLKDIAVLLDLASGTPEHLGDAHMLDRYERARKADIQMRVAGITMLNKTSQTGRPLIQQARAFGMQALHDIAPVRQTLMRMGLGAKG